MPETAPVAKPMLQAGDRSNQPIIVAHVSRGLVESAARMGRMLRRAVAGRPFATRATAIAHRMHGKNGVAAGRVSKGLFELTTYGAASSMHTSNLEPPASFPAKGDAARPLFSSIGRFHLRPIQLFSHVGSPVPKSITSFSRPE